MIDGAFVRTMARYNRWQNENLFGAADGLSQAARMESRGAFFGSIQGTLNHLLWGDRMWMHRFSGSPKPEIGIRESNLLFEDWRALTAARKATDEDILAWAEELDIGWLEGDLAWYSGAAQRNITAPKTLLVTHFFNHQTHHRGQVHAMLTAAGATPEDTDLMLMAAGGG